MAAHAGMKHFHFLHLHCLPHMNPTHPAHAGCLAHRSLKALELWDPHTPPTHCLPLHHTLSPMEGSPAKRAAEGLLHNPVYTSRLQEHNRQYQPYSAPRYPGIKRPADFYCVEMGKTKNASKHTGIFLPGIHIFLDVK